MLPSPYPITTPARIQNKAADYNQQICKTQTL